MRNSVKNIFILGIILIVSGCALTSGGVELHYLPISQINQIIKINDKEVILDIIYEQETPSDLVSHKTNGYGMKMAPIYSTNVTITEFVKNAVIKELTNIGVEVGDNGKRIEIKIKKFYGDFGTNFFYGWIIADVILDVKVFLKEEILFSRTYMGNAEESNLIFFTENHAKNTLEKATSIVLYNLFADNEFINSL